MSDTKFNATTHGCCSLENLILSSENIKDLEALSAAWYNTYRPQIETEQHMIDQLVAVDWLLQRSVCTLADLEKELHAEQPNPRKWTEQDHKALTRFHRYRTANQNAFNKCRRTIEDHFKGRLQEMRQSEKLTMEKERHVIYKEKNKPKPTIQESLALMRQQSIALGYTKVAPAPDPGLELDPIQS